MVVIGVIALLIAIIIPPLSLARREAMRTRCSANLQQLGISLQVISSDHDDFYPLWDDGGAPVRYTWIDVLVQTRVLASTQAGYCPEDFRPDAVNSARAQNYGVFYPGAAAMPGIDYSYGISVPLSAGGWAWTRVYADDDPRLRRFVDHESHPSERVMAADASWSTVYNLSGDVLNNVQSAPEPVLLLDQPGDRLGIAELAFHIFTLSHTR